MKKRMLSARLNLAVADQLTELDLSHLNLSECPREILELRKLKVLNLSQNPIKELPDWMEQLAELERLYLGATRISRLPGWMSQFKNLIKLSLSGTRIKVFPEEIRSQEKLQNLSIRGTQVKELPDWIGNLKALQRLDVRKTGITALPPSLSELDNLEALLLNPEKIENVPLEILHQDVCAVKNYLATLRKDKTSRIYEAKLILIGSGGVGKTSLAKKLIDDGFQLDEDEATTEGIGIIKWKAGIKINGGSEDFTINVWDFGGQEIYRSTHQFFLTRRSLYLLVWEARREGEEVDFDYWFNIVKILSDNSPIIVVLNKIDERTKLIDQASLKKYFPNIVNFHQASVRSGAGVNDLRRLIRKEIGRLPHIGNLWPEAWSNIRKRIEDDGREYLDYPEYLQIVAEYGLDEEKAKYLSSYLHDLGVILHFQDDYLLKNIMILNPQWATNSVYKVLDSKMIRQNNGKFGMADLDSAWQDFPGDKRPYLLQLMMKFELCFKMADNESYIVPELLSYDIPDYSWTGDDNLRFEYRYDFMPRGIMTRFIVKSSNNIYRGVYWKHGVLLEYMDTRAMVVERYFERKLTVTLEGSSKEIFQGIIRSRIEEIHANYANLAVDEWLPCWCSECAGSDDPHFYRYSVLKKYRQKGLKRILCEKSLLETNIMPMEAVSRPGKAKPSVFISYSHKDSYWLERILTFLKPLKREKTIDVWTDRDISPGSVWREDIEKALKSARIAVLVVSQDFLASDFIAENELPPLLQSAQTGGTLILPLIVRPSIWGSCRELSSFQAINDPEEPLSGLPEVDQEKVLVKLARTIEKYCSGK